MYVSLSPSYSIRNEAEASFLIRVDKIINLRRSDFGAFCIPPFMGYILAHIGDYEYEKSIQAIGDSLHIAPKAIEKFVKQLISNQENKEFRLSDTQAIVLPCNPLIETEEKPTPSVHESFGFTGLCEYKIKRPDVPISTNLMVTTKCTTDCVYCYANRNLHPDLSTEKFLDIITELHSQGTINLTLTGGDIFARPDWEIILKHVRELGYKPFLSTKTPLTLEQVKYLRELGYEEIQFSLDSSDIAILKQMIKVGPNYIDKVKNFFGYCDELGLNILIRSVLTKINASIDKVHSLYNLLLEYPCVKEWIMTPAFFSKYKEEGYKSLEVENDDLVRVYEFSKEEGHPFRIGLNKINKKGYELKQFSSAEEYVRRNQICMANVTCLSILANGDCSVCEMLYDNPDYILGNVTESSVSEIWNSEKALNLYTMTQSEFPALSACHSCSVFEKCRNGFGKRVCYLDIAKTGKEMWEPDPRCPNATEVNIIL